MKYIENKVLKDILKASILRAGHDLVSWNYYVSKDVFSWFNYSDNCLTYKMKCLNTMFLLTSKQQKKIIKKAEKILKE